MAGNSQSESHLVKIPKSEYETLMAARTELMRQGFQKLPPQIIENARIKGILQGRKEGFTQGAVVSIGLAALLYLLSKEP